MVTGNYCGSVHVTNIIIIDPCKQLVAAQDV